MLHMGAVLPNLTFAADAHYHHLVDDVIVGGPPALRERRHRRADQSRTRCAARPREARPLTTRGLLKLAPTLTDQDPLRPGVDAARAERPLGHLAPTTVCLEI